MSFVDLVTTPTVTYSRRTYTVSGRLMGLWPGTRETAPVSGMPVQALIPGGDFTPEVTTGARGQFRMSGPVEYPNSYSGSLTTLDTPSHPHHSQGYANLPEPALRPAVTRITISLDRHAIRSREPITVTGVASWKSPDGWAPLADAPIAIGLCPRGQDDDPLRCFGGPTTSTDAHGRYTWVLSPYDGSRIAAAVSSSDMFVQQTAHASARIRVLMPASFDGFYAFRDAATGQVQVGGKLDQTYSPASTLVSAQFSRDGETGWRTIGTIDLGPHAGTFHMAYGHPRPGYWRLTYAGEPGLLEPARTEPVHVS